jgi:hypothetical protein
VSWPGPEDSAGPKGGRPEKNGCAGGGFRIVRPARRTAGPDQILSLILRREVCSDSRRLSGRTAAADQILKV